MDQAKQNLRVIQKEPAPAGQPPASGGLSDRGTEVGVEEKRLLASVLPETIDGGAAIRRNTVSKTQLINKLNYLNFVNGSLVVNYRHPVYGETSSLPASPLPCLDGRLECRWAAGIDTRIFQTHHFQSLLLTKDREMIEIVPEVVRVDHRGICFDLPESAVAIGDRRVRRHRCKGITSQLVQNSRVFSGRLTDFNACSFKVCLAAHPPQSSQWLEEQLPVNVILTSQDRTLYSGECRILRFTKGLRQRHYVLAPLRSEIQRYRKTEYRSQRQYLKPSPNLIFVHPLTGSRVDLKVVDLSGSGFSVEEDQHNALLLPGLILPQVELDFASTTRVKCSAQVVFRKPLGADGNVRCGLALMDIGAQDHVRLIGLLHQARDRNAYICNEVDLNALWDFFFETGFIYPSKYALLEQNKDQIKVTYERLYSRSPNIARHFIYQDKGVILGHMAMVRFYEDAWLIHHHAARRNALNRAGLVVLDQIGRFAYDAYRLDSMHMNYLICYYRPENRFPSRVFGGLARHIGNPKGCSLDAFAFIQPPLKRRRPVALPRPWKLMRSTEADLAALNVHYENRSGGLALDALDLLPETFASGTLSSEYRRHGFTREKRHFSLKRHGQLKAFFVATVSDIGLNLSDLTNCLKAFVLDESTVTADVLQQVFSRLTATINQPAMPVLLFPAAYAVNQGIPHEKQYLLWTLRTHGQSDKYFQYLNRLLRYK